MFDFHSYTDNLRYVHHVKANVLGHAGRARLRF